MDDGCSDFEFLSFAFAQGLINKDLIVDVRVLLFAYLPAFVEVILGLVYDLGTKFLQTSCFKQLKLWFAVYIPFNVDLFLHLILLILAWDS